MHNWSTGQGHQTQLLGGRGPEGGYISGVPRRDREETGSGQGRWAGGRQSFHEGQTGQTGHATVGSGYSSWFNSARVRLAGQEGRNKTHAFCEIFELFL